MKKPKTIFVLGFVGFAGLLLAQGIPVQRTTRLTISEPTEVQGTILQPGTYTLKVLDFRSGKITVQVTDASDRNVLTTVMAQRLRRDLDTDQERSDAAEFTYTVANGHPALSTWYYPGDEWGEKFASGKVQWPAEQVGTIRMTPIEQTAKVETPPSVEPAPQPAELPKTLPQTASDLPLVGMAGLALLGAAGGLRLLQS